MEKIRLHRAEQITERSPVFKYQTGRWDKGLFIDVYESGPVDALVEAAKGIFEAKQTIWLDGPSPVLRLISALTPFEQSGNTGEMEDSHEGD